MSPELRTYFLEKGIDLTQYRLGMTASYLEANMDGQHSLGICILIEKAVLYSAKRPSAAVYTISSALCKYVNARSATFGFTNIRPSRWVVLSAECRAKHRRAALLKLIMDIRANE